MQVEIDVAPVFRPLLSPARYKGAYGGRGSGKSWFFAGECVEALLDGKAVVCIREVQNTIADSVKKLIEARVEDLGLSDYFKVTDKEITCPMSGGYAIFRGMQNHTASSIKSLEGFDVAWWEEAQTASQRSLDLLIPTIRAKGSELWFGWNPDEENAPIEFLRHDPPDGAVVVQANWSDNPWFPEVLRGEMERDRKRDPDKHAHIWNGQYRGLSEARVFRNWRVEDLDASIPDNAVWFYGADWGFANDATAAVRCCIPSEQTLYVSHEVYGVGVPTDALPALLNQLPGAREWPMRGDSARPETIDYLRRHGFPRLRSARKGKGSVEDGISFLQGMDIVAHPRCANLVQELSRYAYKTDRRTGEVLPVLEDANNHCIAEGQRVLTDRGLIPIEEVVTSDSVMTRAGWKRVLFSGVTDTNRDVVEVETTTGKVVCTPDHKIYTSSGFKRADELRYGDEIRGVAEWEEIQSRRSNGAGRFGAAGQVLTTGQTESIFSAASQAARYIFTALFGKGITDQSPKASTSTMWTEIAATTQSRTLSVFPPKTTSTFTSMASEGSASASGWTVSGTWPQIGMVRKRAENGTAKTEGGCGRAANLRRWNANTAALRMKRLTGALVGSAVMLANQLGAALRAWMMRSASASFAVRPSSRTNTKKCGLVRGHVLTVKERGKSARVYDLTVEGQHEFFCENVLVHNCLDALRYALEGVHRRGKIIKAPEVRAPDRLLRPRDGYTAGGGKSAEGWKVV